MPSPVFLSFVTGFSFTPTCLGGLLHGNVCMVMSVRVKLQNVLIRLKLGLGTFGQLIKM